MIWMTPTDIISTLSTFVTTLSFPWFVTGSAGKVTKLMQLTLIAGPKGSGGKAGAGAGGGFTALGNNDIFFSHCWRGKNEVLTKRKWDINELLSRPVELQGGGFTIWADYLDLQAKGPVAWRKEIDGAQPEVITRKMMLEARTPAKDKKQKKKEPSKKLGVRFT